VARAFIEAVREVAQQRMAATAVTVGKAARKRARSSTLKT
jgi:hypothetical protein